MHSHDVIACEELLRLKGYRVTKGRTDLLMCLKHSHSPLSAKEIHTKMNHSLDKVTLYRALEDFVTSKIITKVNLQGASTYYEFTHNDHHHHHIQCERCGKVEHVEICNESVLQKEVLASSKTFTDITSHSLEFFGICNACCGK